MKYLHVNLAVNTIGNLASVPQYYETRSIIQN